VVDPPAAPAVPVSEPPVPEPPVPLVVPAVLDAPPVALDELPVALDPPEPPLVSPVPPVAAVSLPPLQATRTAHRPIHLKSLIVETSTTPAPAHPCKTSSALSFEDEATKRAGAPGAVQS
jgi:hypothetical protein